MPKISQAYYFLNKLKIKHVCKIYCVSGEKSSKICKGIIRISTIQMKHTELPDFSKTSSTFQCFTDFLKYPVRTQLESKKFGQTSGSYWLLQKKNGKTARNI